MAPIPFVRVRKTPTAGGFWVQELCRPRLGHGLWQTPANGSWSHMSVRKSTSSRSTSQIHGETDTQTGRLRQVRPRGQVSGWAGGGRHAAKPLDGRSSERRQVPPHGAEAPGSASAALTVGAPAPRRGGGDVPGGQDREMGQLGGWGAEPPSRCTESAWKGSRQQLQGWRGVSGRPVPRSPRCPPLAHWLQWGAPQGQGHLLLWGAGAEASRLITKER